MGIGPGGNEEASGAKIENRSRAPLNAEPISVVVVDDAALVRERIADLIANDQRLALAAKAGDGVEGLAMIAEHEPDVIVLDVFMPRMGGAAVLRVLRSKLSAAKVLMLTGGPSAELHDAIIARPDSMLYKDAIAEGQICEEIVGLVAGKEDTVGQKLFRAAAAVADGRADLTPSELAVLRCAAEDASAKEIAAKLDRKVKHIQNQLQAIHRKLEVSTTVGAVAKAYEIGLLLRPRGADHPPGA